MSNIIRKAHVIRCHNCRAASSLVRTEPDGSEHCLACGYYLGKSTEVEGEKNGE